MEQTILLTIIAASVLVSAIALCMQAAFLLGLYKTTKALKQTVMPLVPKITALVEGSRTTVEQSKKQIVVITTKSTEILDSAKSVLASLEDVVSDATSRAKVQIERAEMVVDDTRNRIEETVRLLHSGVMRPIRHLNGTTMAIRAIFTHLLGKSRSTSSAGDERIARS